MGTLPNSFGNQRPSSSQVQGPPRIIQDHERNEGSRTRVTSGQNSAVYIGQVVHKITLCNYLLKEKTKANKKLESAIINISG